MGKRFTDTDIWSKPWYRKLSPVEKCAFSYIKDNCDNVGVWCPDFELAEFIIGEKIDWEGLFDGANGNIEKLKNGKWWLKDYIFFQHGDFSLNSKNNAHKSYIALLKRHGLYERIKDILSDPSEGSKKGLPDPSGNTIGKGTGTGKGKGKGKGNNLEMTVVGEEKDKTGTEAKECLDYYFQKHKADPPEGRGFEPMIDGPRDMKMFKRILKNYDVPGFKEVIDAFFEWPTRSDFTTRALYNKVDTLHGVLKRKAEGRR